MVTVNTNNFSIGNKNPAPADFLFRRELSNGLCKVALTLYH